MKQIILLNLLIICFGFNANAKFRWVPTSSLFDIIPVRINESIPISEIEDGYYYMLIEIGRAHV